MTNQQLMLQSKAWLKGGWNKSAVATLIYSLVCAAPLGLGLTSIISLLIGGPMAYGYYLYINRQIDHQEQDFNLLFDGFTTRFVQSMVAGVLGSIAITIGLILLIVPGIIVAIGLQMTFLIMIDNKDITGIDALKASWDLMNGHKWNFFCLCLRFIGWYILCLLSLGILTFWIQPYYYCTIVGFYRQLRGNKATIY